MSPTNISSGSADRISESATDYVEVNLTSADFVSTRPFRGLHVGVAGDVVITSPVTGKPVTLKGLTPGLWPYAGKVIMKTGTTASSIVALY